MFDKILVYEDSLAHMHPALDRAVSLAKGTNIELKIIDVVPAQDDSPHARHRKMRSMIDLEREDRLEAICEPLHDLKITYSTELLRGRPFAEIVREVVHDGFDLVIKTASLASSNEISGVMGPTDLRIVRNCPCPVWLEVASQSRWSKTILVAVDPQTVIDDLNIAMIKRSVKLAASMDLTLHVVAAWQFEEEDFLMGSMESEKLNSHSEFLESNARKSLNELLLHADEAIQASDVHFRKGTPSEVILDCVEKLHPDLVVMGTVCEVGIGGLLMGNTADTVLRRIDCPVLAIKPDALFST